MDAKQTTSERQRNALIPPRLAILLVFFCLGEVGESLNVLEGIYLVDRGWNEGSVGLALSLVGFTALIVQPWAGDWVDKTTFDRRIFISVASIVTAISASVVLFVRPGNYTNDHILIYVFKIIEGVASSFIIPCISAVALATFGHTRFDEVMASIMLWGHVGSVVMTLATGAVAYQLYPNVEYCFLVIAASALLATIFVPFMPEGDPMVGRGFEGKTATNDEDGYRLESDGVASVVLNELGCELHPKAASYLETLTDRQTCLLCFTGFFYQFADANVVLVLGELMGNEDANGRESIPLIALAIVIAQLVMAYATSVGDWLTTRGIGRTPILMAGLLTLPVRCFLIILWKKSGDPMLLSTQILDGVGGGFLGLIYPLIVADITFGTGRFNLVMGLVASFFGLGTTLSNYLGQLIVQEYGHTASLQASLILSLFPIVLFAFFQETRGDRGNRKTQPPSAFTMPIIQDV